VDSIMSAWSEGRPQLQRMMVALPALILLAWSVGSVLAGGRIETLRASTILSVLAITSIVLFWTVTRAEPQGRTLFYLLLLSFALKLGAAYFRFVGRLLADAFVYSQIGAQIAEQLARGQWPYMSGFTGTEFVRLATGLVYFVTGPTLYGATILWAWFGLLGMLFFYKAFTTALPQANRRLYMVLILLYPSMLLWTSSLGKDALVVFFLGMAAFGTARLKARIDFSGVWWLALGLGGMLLVRPHIAAVFVVALAAFALTRPIHAGMMTPVIRLVGLLIFVAIAAAVVRTAAGFVRLESLAAADIEEFIQVRQERTAQGGSAFVQVNPFTPTGFLLAIPTVLFRPFPWEAGNAFAVIAALEGLGLMALMVYRWRSVWAAIVDSRRDGYLLLVLVYALLFMFFFSAIANFGIIARQRVQLIPFVFMWIAYLPRRGQEQSRA
jgi:hypothetical protein